jgi:hypothetical protein
MMNYGEELAYWYLRLNGCFALADFVMHRGATLKYTSDCDILAVRPPYVVEEIGGQPDDWDPSLSQFFDDGCILGIVCEAKTGGYDRESLFRPANLVYAVRRLGLVDNPDEVAKEFAEKRSFDPREGLRLVKLLITNDPIESEKCVCVSVEQIRSFLRSRFLKYHESKFRDRIFFPSALIQYVIDEVHIGTRPQRKWEEPPIETRTARRL